MGGDHIKLNEYYMDQYGDCAKKNVTMHEMGHALGLEHWDTYSNVMRDYITKYYYQCDFGTHDIIDYEELWGDSE